MESNLEKCLKELEDPNAITAEKALQHFSYPCFSLEAYKKEDDEPNLIFHAYMKFIRFNLRPACIDGIWEDILRKTVMYSKHFSILLNDNIIFNNPDVTWWLNTVLSSREKCPNPYIRLELLRLIRMFQIDWEHFDCYNITDTFIYTICEIQPCLLYPSGNENEVLFGVIDLKYFMDLCNNYGNLILNISSKIGCFLSKDINCHKRLLNIQINYMESNELRFILHFVQLIGIFAVMTGSITNPRQQINTLSICFTLFRDTICSLVDQGNIFRHVIKDKPFNEYVAETIRDLTSAVTNLTMFRISTNRMFMSVIDEITEYLGYTSGYYFSEPCDLPRLLLNRQMHGSTPLALQHSIYMRKLKPTYNDEDNIREVINNTDSDYSDNSDIFFTDEFSDSSENISSYESNEDSENPLNDESSNNSDNSCSESD